MKEFVRSLVAADRPVFAVLQSIGVQFGVVLINLATGVVTARLLGPDGRGVFAAVTMWPQLAAQLAIAGLGSGVVLHLSRSAGEDRAWTGAALLLTWLTTTAVIGVAALCLPRFLGQYGRPTLLLAELCLLVAYQNATQMTIKQVFVGLGEVRWFNICNLISQAFYLAALVACAFAGRLDVTAAILALFGSGALSLAAVIPPLLRRARPTLAAPWGKLRQLFGYSLRAAGTDVVSTLSAYIDKLVLVPLLSASQLGYYVVAFSFSRTVLLIQPAIASVILSNMSHRSADEAKRLHDHAFRFGLLAMILFVVAVTAVDRRMLSAFYGAEFASAVVVFRILLLEAICTCLAGITCQLYLSLNRPGFTSAVQGASILISIAALPPLVRLEGPQGAAWGLLAAAAFRLAAYLAGIPILLRMRAPRLHLVADDLAYVAARLRGRAA